MYIAILVVILVLGQSLHCYACNSQCQKMKLGMQYFALAPVRMETLVRNCAIKGQSWNGLISALFLSHCQRGLQIKFSLHRLQAVFVCYNGASESLQRLSPSGFLLYFLQSHPEVLGCADKLCMAWMSEK